MENPIKIDDLGVPLFLETPIYIHPFYTWCLNHASWKICSSIWIIYVQVGVKIKNVWNHHPVYHVFQMKAKPLSATTSKLYVGPLFANVFQEVFRVIHFSWKGFMKWKVFLEKEMKIPNVWNHHTNLWYNLQAAKNRKHNQFSRCINM